MRQAPQSVTRTLLIPTALGLILAATMVFSGCKKDEPPPPLPSATVSSEPPAPIELAMEEDAGAEDADAAKATGPYKPRKSLANCCAALRQNAANAPAPTNTYMLYAAGICDGAAAANKGSAALPAIRAALRGAPLPAACY